MFKDLLKTHLFPTSWCPGCGIGGIMAQLAMAMDEMGLNQSNSVVVGGIGCTGRMAGYFNLDSVYTLHGRTLPVAQGIKMVNPSLKVIIISGDGDLASIGGNHLIHALRRNVDLAVLCNNNEVYGLTGGQAGPTTPQGTPTVSSPDGSPYEPLNLQGLLKTGSRYFYARTTVYHQVHLKRCIKEAIQWPGFAFVDIASQCIENNGRRLGFKTGYEMLAMFRDKYKRAPDGVESLAPLEIGLVKRGEEQP
ncbi:MAG: 2-oxoacid:ferredoxin oxidoreductase subunit beta [Chloroflexi bacterium]|nr:2-oxoacid:ferredoxin oxidoreductase subunit beta [Chloroflexota bacterium]